MNWMARRSSINNIPASRREPARCPGIEQRNPPAGSRAGGWLPKHLLQHRRKFTMRLPDQRCSSSTGLASISRIEGRCGIQQQVPPVPVKKSAGAAPVGKKKDSSGAEQFEQVCDQYRHRFVICRFFFRSCQMISFSSLAESFFCSTKSSPVPCTNCRNILSPPLPMNFRLYSSSVTTGLQI